MIHQKGANWLPFLFMLILKRQKSQRLDIPVYKGKLK